MNRFSWNGLILRLCFVVLTGALAAATHPFALSPPVAAVIGAVVGIAATLTEARLRRARLKTIIGGAAGMLVGITLGLLFVHVLNQSSMTLQNPTLQFLRLALPFLGGYIGAFVGVSKSELLPNFGVKTEDTMADTKQKILDTSVLIDGRIVDIAESGFLDGLLVVPQFVLNELQLVADSAESSKRNRGRRGLDVVHQLQKAAKVRIEITFQDFPAIREVDRKLIEYGKAISAKIVTTDFNLNKLAQVQGVEVLNINELANALKPIVLPGETMRVFILKEGKEAAQGVAYLDDGTMVVVDNARRFISKNVDVTVTSVLQTTAGKMIFAKFDERHAAVEPRTIVASAGTPAS